MAKMMPMFLLSGVLAGCAGADSGAQGGGPPMTAIGMPVFLALKVPFCIATVAIAAPLAGISGFAPTYQAVEVRQDLDQGVAQNCSLP